ncbi:LLM class flavin-dependent oxidoreductase [Ornithinimicrobium tianjinense]|uniref:Oxidoreductase n=1 Tax=Ornithinimicrobium tianjinense TaxID=1195761 RepID=A0A917F739_9MICO|nr:LLM class flavin-dependent oxidoreductase [Ornithinimicrobium tianjinense]GGF50310.1 oxidoreductase [Ornithinimicrobium tianjinense]
MSVQLGLDTFGDMTLKDDGTPETGAQVIRNLVDQGVLADQVGVDFIGVGEHHRPDFAVSAPDVVLAGLATRTERIQLGTAVTVLSSDDPIRVFERFSTIDALSGGRAEVVLGRGSFTESFPLFGFDLRDYDTLFSEKLDLFSALLDEGPVSWEGTTRPPLVEQEVWPKTESGRLTAWIAVGGSPQSVVRAASYRIPLMLAIIGGPAQRFVPFADLYRRVLEEAGAPQLPVAVHSPGHVAETDELAREQLFPHFKANRDRIGAERGWGPVRLEDYHSEITHGSLYVGSPETVAQKIAATVRALKLDRFDLKYANGPMPHSQLMRSIELYGTQVVPRVRELLAEG